MMSKLRCDDLTQKPLIQIVIIYKLNCCLSQKWILSTGTSKLRRHSRSIHFLQKITWKLRFGPSAGISVVWVGVVQRHICFRGSVVRSYVDRAICYTENRYCNYLHIKVDGRSVTYEGQSGVKESYFLHFTMTLHGEQVQSPGFSVTVI